MDTNTTTPAPGWTGRADYAERREARIDRLNESAQRHAAAASSKYGHARAMVAGIPLGQPNIGGRLTGLYNRHDAAMRAAFRENDAAEAAQARAAAAERNNAISSDDPEAITRLRAKLAGLEKAQGFYKAANAALRQKDAAKGDAALVALGCSAEQITKLRTPDFVGRIGFPSYVLSNNNAQIRSVKQRIEQLEARANGPAPEGWTFDGGEVICNVGENRLQIRFDTVPEVETRSKLKANGFRWSRWGGVWQRQLTRNAIFAARQMFAAAR